MFENTFIIPGMILIEQFWWLDWLDQLMLPEDTIEENIVKCNVSKMELDYKFGGQSLGWDSADMLDCSSCTAMR